MPRSGACTQPGFCLPLKLWDLGVIEVKIRGSTRKCRSAPGGKFPLLFPLNQCGRKNSSFFSVASSCKCGDASGLGIFGNWVSRPGLEWILNEHFCIFCLSLDFLWQIIGSVIPIYTNNNAGISVYTFLFVSLPQFKILDLFCSDCISAKNPFSKGASPFKKCALLNNWMGWVMNRKKLRIANTDLLLLEAISLWP